MELLIRLSFELLLNYVASYRSPSHLHGAALRLHEAAGGDVGPAAAGRQEAVLLFKPRTLKVRVVGETATLQLGQKTHTAEEHERTAFNG